MKKIVIRYTKHFDTEWGNTAHHFLWSDGEVIRDTRLNRKNRYSIKEIQDAIDALITYLFVYFEDRIYNGIPVPIPKYATEGEIIEI